MRDKNIYSFLPAIAWQILIKNKSPIVCSDYESMNLVKMSLKMVSPIIYRPSSIVYRRSSRIHRLGFSTFRWERPWTKAQASSWQTCHCLPLTSGSSVTLGHMSMLRSPFSPSSKLVLQIYWHCLREVWSLTSLNCNEFAIQLCGYFPCLFVPSKHLVIVGEPF